MKVAYIFMQIYYILRHCFCFFNALDFEDFNKLNGQP